MDGWQSRFRCSRHAPDCANVMRLGFILPAETALWGGVQRFAASLRAPLSERAHLVDVRIHPRRGQSRASAFASAIARLHASRPLDAVFTTFHYPPALLPGVPALGFVHDVRMWGLHHEAGEQRRGRWSPHALVARTIFGSWDRVLVPTPHVARDVQWLLPSQVVVAVGEGADHLPPGSAVGDRDRLVVVAGRAPHKRAELGVAAALQAGRALGLDVIVVGAMPPRFADVTVGLRQAGALTDQGLSDLLSAARAVVLASSYEGFGLAAVEALHAGAPVVYARDCPLDSVVGDAGVGVDPTEAAMQQGIIEAAGRPGLGEQGRRQAARWTWAQTADRVLEQVGDVVSGNRRVRRYF